MPSNFELTKYYNNPKCSECGQNIAKWAVTKCDNCGSSVCSRHRPMRSLPWQCSKCRQRQQSFIQPNSTAYASVENIFIKLAEAQDLFDDGLNDKANQIIDEVLRNI